MEEILKETLNKVKNTFSSAASNAASIASQVQQYLPGNPIYREYDVTAQVSSAGRGLVWKVYEGYRKSNKEEVSLFIFEKRQIEKISKNERENILNLVRKGVSQLTRLRHPQILTVQHPLEESRELLAFATEPVFASLVNILGNMNNISSVPSALKGYVMHDVEIKYGILQLSEALSFLHDSVKMVHRCLTPENVIVNKQGAWKFFGFDFCVVNVSATPEEPNWPFEDYDSTNADFLQPDLDYMAPEYVATHSIDTKVDMFSLGIVIYALYNNGKPLYQNYNDFPSFRRRAVNLENSKNIELPNIPTDLKVHVKTLLQFKPEDRPDGNQLSKISYFNDVTVNTLRYLDKMFQWDNLQKSQFYKKLPQIIPHLPHRMALLRVIPSLNKECVNPSMVPFVLPAMLQVTDNASKDEFEKHIFPYLKEIMKISEPIQVMLLLLQKIELLLSKTTSDCIQSDILPLVFRSIECNTQQIQELSLSCIPTCVPHCSKTQLREEVLPRIRTLCLQTDYLSVRVNCLICIGKIIQHMDKWAIPEHVFEFLIQVPSKESAVVMAIVGIYQVAFQHKNLGVSKEILGCKVIPSLMPLSIENALSVSQHSTIMSLIRDMINKVEEEQRKKLKLLEEARIEQESLKIQLPTDMPLNDISELFPDNQLQSLNNSDSLGNIFGHTTNSEDSRPHQGVSPRMVKSTSLSTNLTTSQVNNLNQTRNTDRPSPIASQKSFNSVSTNQEIDPWSSMSFNLKKTNSMKSTVSNVHKISMNNQSMENNVCLPSQATSSGNYGVLQKPQPFATTFAGNFNSIMQTSPQSFNNARVEKNCKSLSAAEISEFLK